MKQEINQKNYQFSVKSLPDAENRRLTEILRFGVHNTLQNLLFRNSFPEAADTNVVRFYFFILKLIEVYFNSLLRR